MNLSFQLRNHKGLREDPFWQPYKLVSLWDMLHIYAKSFAATCQRLSSFSAMLFAAKRAQGANVPPTNGDQLLEGLKLSELVDDFEAMELPLASKAAQRLANYLKDNPAAQAERVECDIRELIKRFNDELNDRLFMMLLSSSAQYYELPGTILGKQITEWWPELIEDATEAGNCFALGRYTACVFHLMRIVERYVQKMGDDLGLPEKITREKEWGYILNNMRGPIKKRYPNEKNDMRVRYEAVIASLDTVRITWRNRTMHPKATYTKEEAEKIIRAVQTFTEDFSVLSGFFSLWLFFRIFAF
ncbi:MAG: hypothetical protein HY913_21745 [Desulfomonile tiedjei]|nr:hypothetical protein [Desulfomonile tiedjei]